MSRMSILCEEMFCTELFSVLLKKKKIGDLVELICEIVAGGAACE